jgi:spheroidene monooxygenase
VSLVVIVDLAPTVREAATCHQPPDRRVGLDRPSTRAQILRVRRREGCWGGPPLVYHRRVSALGPGGRGPSSARAIVGAPPAATRAVEASVVGAAPVGLVLLVDLAPSSIPFAISRLMFGRWLLARVPGLRFGQVMGSGQGGGFGLRPSATHQGLFLVFDDDASADAFVDRSPLVAGYRARARELFTVKLRAFASRGAWGGRAPFVVDERLAAEVDAGAPIAALTRATIRPARMLRFWRRAAPAQASATAAAGCLLAAGLGEAPLLRQATFTIWSSVDAMDRYARHGAHQAAIDAAYGEDFFSEYLFTRFLPYGARGTWHGRAVETRVAAPDAPALPAPR